MASNDRLQKIKHTLIANKSSENTSSNAKDSITVQSIQSSAPTRCNMNSSGFTLNPTAPPNTVALDSGAYSIKVGECSEKKPLTNVIPNCIMKAKAERKRVFIGNEIEDCRDLSGLYYQLPTERGYVTRWDLQKTIWTQTVKPYLNDDTTLIMTQPIVNFRESQEAVDEIFFEEYYIKAMCRQYASDYLVFNHMQRHGNDGTCIVVDSGYSSTWIIPYVDGIVYKKGLIRIDVGGKLLTNHMKEILSYRQLNVMEETCVINQMKEDACYVARSFSRDMQVAKKTGPENTIARTYVLPDFNTIRRGYIAEPNSDMATLADSYQLLKLNNERFTVPELLFQPSMIGFQQMGVAEAIAQCINRMPDYMQRTLCGNVILCGGCTKLIGYKNRLGKDLRSLTPSKHAVELFVSADPVTWAWRCAASFAKISDLNAHCVTRFQYEEYGSRFVYDKFEASWNRDIEPSETSFTIASRPSILNYSENVFAVPKTNDSEVVILSDSEDPVDRLVPKTMVQSSINSSLAQTSQIQTRSSQAVLTCPPLIIASPSSAVRSFQPRKVHIEQCLSIMGGHIVDETDRYRTSSSTSVQPVRHIPSSIQQPGLDAQQKKPLYLTDGKRLFHADGTQPNKVKTSTNPRACGNPDFIASKNKLVKKQISQRSTNTLRPSPSTQPTQESNQDQHMRPVSRVMSKTPRPSSTNTTETKQQVLLKPKTLTAQSQPSISSISLTPRPGIKQRPVHTKQKLTTNLFESSSSGSLIQLTTLSKQSIEQLRQVTKVVLQPLSQSTLDATAISSAATYAACTMDTSVLDAPGVRISAEPSTTAVDVGNEDSNMEVEDDAMIQEPIASASNGADVRSARIRRGGRTNGSLKRRQDE